MVFMFFTTMTLTTIAITAITTGATGSSAPGTCSRKGCCGCGAIRDECSGAKRIPISIGDSGLPVVRYSRESLQVVDYCRGGISAIGIGIFSLLKELVPSSVSNSDSEWHVRKVGNVEIEGNL